MSEQEEIVTVKLVDFRSASPQHFMDSLSIKLKKHIRREDYQEMAPSIPSSFQIKFIFSREADNFLSCPFRNTPIFIQVSMTREIIPALDSWSQLKKTSNTDIIHVFNFYMKPHLIWSDDGKALYLDNVDQIDSGSIATCFRPPFHNTQLYVGLAFRKIRRERLEATKIEYPAINTIPLQDLHDWKIIEMEQTVSMGMEKMENAEFNTRGLT